jgi:hypothetical protein
VTGAWTGARQLNVFSYFVILSSFIPLSLMVSLELASFAQVGHVPLTVTSLSRSRPCHGHVPATVTSL